MEQAHRLRTTGDLEAAADRADRALNLWHGEPLAGLDARPFLIEYERRLRELRLDAHRERADARRDLPAEGSAFRDKGDPS